MHIFKFIASNDSSPFHKLLKLKMLIIIKNRLENRAANKMRVEKSSAQFCRNEKSRLK